MRLFRRKAAPAPVDYDDDGTFPVLLESRDAARADSSVLDEAARRGVDVAQRLLVRHRLVLPDVTALAVAGELLAQDGYRTTVAEAGPPLQVLAWRTQVLTAMSASQERSRMAGLAQRLGGDVDGWDACGPLTSPSDTS